MTNADASDGRTVALYWDSENIHAGLCEERQPGSYARTEFRFKPQEALVKVQAVVDFAASFGPIAINRAYCNWQWYSRYRNALLQNAVELIQLFPPGGVPRTVQTSSSAWMRRRTSVDSAISGGHRRWRR